MMMLNREHNRRCPPSMPSIRRHAAAWRQSGVVKGAVFHFMAGMTYFH